jgi:glycosyltransferase involved in cell wall biosynthesis
MRIAVVSSQVPFIHGGAEIHAANLIQALHKAGHKAELVAIPFKWYPASTLLDHMTLCRMIDLSESAGQPIDLVIGLKFPAYLVPHPNKVLWILHQHRTAYELWSHPTFGDLIHDPQGLTVRDAIHAADRRFIPESRAVYANSRNVAKRLQHYCGVASEPLYHPPSGPERFYFAEAERYLFFPSRINPMKRQSLVVEALGYCRHQVKVVFAGTPDTPAVMTDLKQLAARLRVEDRLEWRGHISDQEKFDLYARCLGVIYPPVDEDYGYITLEAMLARKPVITTSDAGGPLEFIEHGVSGLVGEATPQALAAHMDELWSDPARAARWGRAGRDMYESLNISWEHAVETLLA